MPTRRGGEEEEGEVVVRSCVNRILSADTMNDDPLSLLPALLWHSHATARVEAQEHDVVVDGGCDEFKSVAVSPESVLAAVFDCGDSSCTSWWRQFNSTAIANGML